MDPDDPTTRLFLLRHVRLGVVVSSIVLPVVLLYLAATPDRPYRGVLLGLASFFAVLTLVMHHVVPWERLFAQGRGMWILGGWTGTTIVLADVCAALDGGPSSPMVGIVFIPLIAGAISYPPRAVLAIGALCVAGHGAVVVTSGAALDAAPLLQAAVLLVATLMCAQSSSNHRTAAAQLKATARDLERLASVDGLTGCVNHRTFQDDLQREVNLAQRTGASVALLIADLDHFKAINDTHGHPVGDDVLRRVAACLRGVVRAHDVIGRIGGEEFAILLPGTDVEAAAQVGERARAAVGTLEEPVHLTVSVGVAALPRLAATAEDLLAAADRGLYRAKRSGRDRVVVAGHGDPVPAAAPSADILARVREVLDQGRLRAVFQPVVELSTGRVLGYEALSRVTGSSMAPPGWLDLAAAVGLRGELEVAMWDAALDSWVTAGPPDDLVLWLNISPDVLVGGLPWTRRARLPANVVLELSELAPVRSYARLRATLDEWREHGVRFAIDDVGAGHANMRHIIELAPEIAKLDRSLVHDVADSSARQAVVRGLVGFCRDVDSVLVAEGVEDEPSAAMLQRLGVGLAQGWHFGRPGDLSTALRQIAGPATGPGHPPTVAA